MKQFLPAVVAGMIGALVVSEASAWALKVWTAPEKVTIAQLNANFAETANNGLVDANLASNAAVAHSKLATPALVSKAWVTLSAVCSTATCTVADSSLVTGVTRSGTGAYTVTWAPTFSATAAVIPAVHEDDKNCRVTARSTTTATLSCKTNGTDVAAPAASDTMFSVVLFDS